MAPVVTAKQQSVRSPRVLVVDDDASLLETVSDVATASLGS